jgi:hypothetical protein
MIARGGEDGPVVGLTAGMSSPPAAVSRIRAPVQCLLSPAMDAANQKPSVCSTIYLSLASYSWSPYEKWDNSVLKSIVQFSPHRLWRLL